MSKQTDDLVNSTKPKGSPLKQALDYVKSGDAHSAISIIDNEIDRWNSNITRKFIRQLGSITHAARLLPPSEKRAIEGSVSKIELNNPHLIEPLYNVMRPIFGNSYRMQRAAIFPIQRQSRYAPFHHICDKGSGRKFASMLGLRVPELFQSSVSHQEIRVFKPSVVKPLNEDGGRAIHGMIPENGILRDAFNNQEYSDLEFKIKLKSYLDREYVRKDEWIVEELIQGPASREGACDVKFYAFYGEIGYILQVERWGLEGKKYNFFTPDGEIAETGKYQKKGEPPPPLFTSGDLEMAKKISREVPWPAIRIDFFASDQGLVFGEFTLNPGAAGSFNQKSDKYLGQHLAAAQARLMDDMIDGRKFAIYRDFLASEGRLEA